MKNLNDSSLVSAYIEGNENALAVLIGRHKQKIYSFIYSKVYDHSLTEDIFQDTFIKAIVTIKEGKYNEEGKFLPWVMRIAYNLTIDHFRAKKKMRTISENGVSSEFSLFDFIKDSKMDAETEMIQNQINEDVCALIQHLPADQLEVLELRIFKGLSFKDIAEETNVSINTALGRMRYALINLRKIIEENQVVLTK